MTNAPTEVPIAPSPMKIMEMISGYEKAAVIKTAIELDIFTAVAEGYVTPDQLAVRCQASKKGVRIISDYLVVEGLLSKEGPEYALTPDSAAFLDRNSRTYIGAITGFLMSDHMNRQYDRLADSVRRGGAASTEESMSPDHSMWIDFAESMIPITMMPANMMADILPKGAKRVLDVSASHGIYGIAVAQRNPEAVVVANDWSSVVEFAKSNATAMGVGDRYQTLPGSAFEVDYGTDYDIILVPNFLHHFDRETIEVLLLRFYAALKPGGCLAIVEFVPNEDRVSPPWPAHFPLKMLATTESGDAYTMPEYSGMLGSTGYEGVERIDLVPSLQTLILARKPVA
jgi:2-polyprenyl-3-methyl-5-hydroxy-6-metoxy-1,4-benzoquinol methylase